MDPVLLGCYGDRARQRRMECGAAQHGAGQIGAGIVVSALAQQSRLAVPRAQSTGDTRRVHLFGGAGVSRHGGRGER